MPHGLVSVAALKKKDIERYVSALCAAALKTTNANANVSARCAAALKTKFEETNASSLLPLRIKKPIPGSSWLVRAALQD